jgi:hypothetical protein
MFGWFRKSPRELLEQRYAAKLKEAKEAGEKYGDRALQARLYEEAEAILAELDALATSEGT